ncbi:hypothetical protein OH76DRAFT_472200 [Lentinus brumalis]|uniref:Uncharacterized protein n=1 Tax=Lentinus brumalis TaxID=2498619 RepID=A0A371DCS3_9APHY|nr:hypothetical protein OH76DRAFT_472200 [Polyporus brumalis]
MTLSVQSTRRLFLHCWASVHLVSLNIASAGIYWLTLRLIYRKYSPSRPLSMLLVHECDGRCPTSPGT